MADIKKKYNVNVKGVLNIENNGRIIMSVEDIGDVPLDQIFDDFDGYEVKLALAYDEDYEEPEIKVNDDGEVIE